MPRAYDFDVTAGPNFKNSVIMKTLKFTFLTGLSILTLVALFNTINFYSVGKIEPTIISITASVVAFYLFIQVKNK